MKKALFIPVLFFIGGASSSPESAWIEPAPVCDIQKSSFQAGESLSYKVFYNAGPMWVGAGEVYFKLNAHQENGREVLHAVSEAVTYKSFDWFFKVRDMLDTYMYANTLQSYKFSRDVNEGGYTFYRSYDWNRSTNTIVSFEDRKNGKTKTETIKNVDPCATDFSQYFIGPELLISINTNPVIRFRFRWQQMMRYTICTSVTKAKKSTKPNWVPSLA